MQRPERERKEPTEFNVIVKAKDLVKHTFTITNSTERYPKKYRFTLVPSQVPSLAFTCATSPLSAGSSSPTTA